ncbi:MAG: hypothetical protein H6735_11465 [Alphaproteobacteria bacterium]|nr:hypothetical protein [Alphaproteobacteria bacterium]
MDDAREAWGEIAATVVLPSLVLVMGSDVFGGTGVLLVGLAPPVLWAVRGMVRQRAVSPMAVLAIIGVSASGIVGLLQLDTRWFAWKEAALGVVIGLATGLSAFTRWCVVAVVLDRLFVKETLEEALTRHGTTEAYRTAVRRSTLTLGVISVAAAVVAGLLARSIVRSPAGTEAFGAEVGYYTGWSFPVITIPSLVFAVIVFRRLLTRIEQLTDMPWDDLLPPLDPGGS